MTAVLTALIWASADRLVNESAVLEVAIVPVPAAASEQMLIRMIGPRDSLEVTVSGPRRVVESVRNRERMQVRIHVPEQPPGEASLGISEENLRRELAQQFSEFERLRVLGVQPQEIRVAVDRIVTRNVEFTLKNLTLAYETEPQLQRKSARLRLRESATAGMPPDFPVLVEIGPDAERLLKEKPFGKSQTVTVVPEVRQFGADAEFNPRSVEVTATVRAERIVQQVPTVPVLVAMSFANLSKSVQAVARDGTPLTLVTQTISVSGTPDAVGRLLSGESRAYGIIHLKQEDLESLGMVKLVTPEYHLPRDVELAGTPAPIELKLIATASGEGDGGEE
jgi:hypothetical protein